VSFSTDVGKFAINAPKQALLVRKLFLKKLCFATIDRTPVKTGYLKGNWQPTLGAPAQGEVPRKSKEGGFVKQLVLTTLEKLEVGQSFFFTNCAPYAYRIEYEGWSSKAPRGMLRISVAEARRFVRAAIREGKLK
jgi:hypothetical protein